MRISIIDCLYLIVIDLVFFFMMMMCMGGGVVMAIVGVGVGWVIGMFTCIGSIGIVCFRPRLLFMTSYVFL